MCFSLVLLGFPFFCYFLLFFLFFPYVPSEQPVHVFAFSYVFLALLAFPKNPTEKQFGDDMAPGGAADYKIISSLLDLDSRFSTFPAGSGQDF